jgi:hypothetical protein
VLWVDPGEIPSDDDVAKLGQALAVGRHGDRDELMANTAAYSGLRWGELTALMQKASSYPMPSSPCHSPTPRGPTFFSKRGHHGKLVLKT